jgi:two-component system, cell cycle sensor histidine kinase and response regulator CckA
MLKIKDLSIKKKMIVIIMLTCVATLLFATLSLMLIEVVSFKNNLIQTNKMLAKVIGSNSRAPLMFNDSKVAEETLSALSADSNIIAGFIMDKRGELFARYSPAGNDESITSGDLPSSQILNFIGRPHREKLQHDDYSFDKKHLKLFHPIMFDGECIGIIYLISDLSNLWHRLSWYAIVCILILLISSLLAFLLSATLHTLISTPIMKLAATMETVSANKDYSSRIQTDSKDEIGSLYQEYNTMLEQIQERDDRLYITHYIIDHMGDAAYMLNKDARFTYVNNAAADLLGYSKAALLSMSIAEVDLKYSEANWMEHWEELQAKKTLTFESQHKLGDGALVSVEVNANYVEFKEEGHYCAFARDISSRKSLEAKLEQAKKLEAIGTLTGGVAHDLNNILGPLVGFPELLLMNVPSDSPLFYPLSAIKESGERAAAVVQDMLTLARRGVIVQEVVNLNHIVAEYQNSPIYRKLTYDFPLVEFTFDLEPILLNILGSPVHLLKCITNLVSNAVESVSGPGKVTLCTRNVNIDAPIMDTAVLKEGDYVVLKISDTGTGISQEDLGRIFEPFYTKKKMGRSGTGLGMTVVRGTVEDHNGFIDVQSALEKGTTVTLHLPITRKEIAVKTDSRSIDSIKGNERILVADDVKEQREIARRLLTYLGYSVNTVSSGEAAIAFLTTNEVDLLLLDMIMDPGIDGLDTYKEALRIHPKQRAVIATGYAETKRVAEALRLGAHAYVKKPYQLTTIGASVRNALDS